MDTDKTPPKTPAKPFNIDADPENANWIRTLAKRRAAEQGEPDPATVDTTPPPAGTVPEPPVIEDVADVPLDPAPTPPAEKPDNSDRPGFAAKGWSTTAKGGK